MQRSGNRLTFNQNGEEISSCFNEGAMRGLSEAAPKVKKSATMVPKGALRQLIAENTALEVEVARLRKENSALKITVANLKADLEDAR